MVCFKTSHLVFICLVTLVFISMTLDDVTSLYLISKTYEIHANASITVKVFGEISSCDDRKMGKSERYTCVSSCLLY